MALRIRPLSESGGASSGGGLRIRPLDDFLASLPSAAPVANNQEPPPPSGPGSHGTWPGVPDDVRAALAGTAWAANSGTQRSFWDTSGEGFFPIGPNTDLITGTENGQYTFQAHPLFPRGSAAYEALVARGRAGGGASSAPGGVGRIGTPGNSINPTLGFGLNGSPTAGEVGAQYGHLAGRNPFMAALDVNPFSGETTPASLLGNIFSGFPGPAGLVGPFARLMFQSGINDAMQTPEGFQGYFDANPIGLGFSGQGEGGSSGASPSYSGDGGAFHAGGSVGAGAPKGPERRAKLLEGEFVVRKDAAEKHRPLLDAINRGESPKKLSKLLAYLMVEDEPTA